MLSPNEQFELKSLIEIANNLVPGIIVDGRKDINILIFGKDVAQWPLYRIVQLHEKDIHDATVSNTL